MKKDSLILKVLAWEQVSRPPVWCMRQAWRYLPWYTSLRKKYDFFTLVRTPELAAEITLEPIRTFGMDAAILFSDILVIPQAMWLEVEMIEEKWPFLPKTIKTLEDIAALNDEDVESLSYVYDAIKLINKDLDSKTALIGFAGAPFTIFCYMIEWKWSKTFDKARKFLFLYPYLAHKLLSKITKITIKYLKKQIQFWVDLVQVFDSWSSVLWPDDFREFILPYLKQISNELSLLVPVILFEKWSYYALSDLSQIGVKALWLDWNISPKMARELSWDEIVLQWNFDPAYLFLSPIIINEKVTKMIDEFWVQNYIVNLWHGILPDTPITWVKAFVDAVKEYKIK